MISCLLGGVIDARVIVVTHDNRTLEVFDVILEMEDGAITGGKAQ